MLLITPPLDQGEFIRFTRRMGKGLGGVVLIPLPSPGSDRETDPHSGVEEVLSPRQIEVLRGLAAGRGAKEIGLGMGISRKTVEAHRWAISQKLGIWNLPGFVRYALRMGVLSPDWLLDKD